MVESNVKLSLLNETLLEIEVGGERSKVSLPELLALLSDEALVELVVLQAHQQHAWHAFTVQLAAIALARAGLSAPPTDKEHWCALLLETAKADGAGEEAFSLVVDDLSKPAFMQPPVPEGNLKGFKNEHIKPSQELDVLLTSKNHDVKMGRLQRPSVEHWIFGLVTLQTMQGFLGAGNYGIARMNGGFSSRPCVAYAPPDSSGKRFRQDLAALLAARADLFDFGYSERGTALIWCVPWNGASSLPFKKLDPFFIEICRRVRLTQRDGQIVAYRGSSKVARIDGSAANGNTGDLWTPVNGEGKALTVSDKGFTYDRVRELMFGEYTQPKWHEVGPFWVGQVLVRGQGRTEGYHERWIPIPDNARSFFVEPTKRDRLGKRALQWVNFASDVRTRILKPALLNLLQGGPEQLKFDDNRADAYLTRLNRAIDEVFFHLLFEWADAGPEAADEAFKKKVLDLAKAELERAITSVPHSAARRQRSIAFAMRSFWGAAKRFNFINDDKLDSTGVGA